MEMHLPKRQRPVKQKNRSKNRKNRAKKDTEQKNPCLFLRLAAAETKIRQEIWRIHPTKCRKDEFGGMKDKTVSFWKEFL